ncbi:hypothetical protein BwSH20_64490 [Bradyrhizobium ottawaense]|nr:hypothetical protein TM233_20370 [Bradyrhizobium sp. TM233]GMO63376.1 hypothetical protein BwSG10_13170 [Bradyrhizobium ottawaense]GMO94538.1 hypothetical protein BwDG23_13170 [Bradyrhizobium ottawaense]GMP10942.1 hypothetical protein BwSH20_64490 [Bradyrhizobium ottawaense]GMP20630.1 hypothetical protein BwSH12_66360 [Bradyrhizobium ottawaense]
MHAIAAGREHAERGVEVLALIDAVEGIGEQHDLAAGLRAKGFRPAVRTHRRERRGAPRRALMPAKRSNSFRNSGLPVRKFASGAKRDARPP